MEPAEQSIKVKPHAALIPTVSLGSAIPQERLLSLNDSYERDGYNEPRRPGATGQQLRARPSEARRPGQEGDGGKQHQLATEQWEEEASYTPLQQAAGEQKQAWLRGSLRLRQVTSQHPEEDSEHAP